MEPDEHLGAGLIWGGKQKAQDQIRIRGRIFGFISRTEVYLSFAGLGLSLLGLRLRLLRSLGGGKDHPLTELCEVRGVSGYRRVVMVTTDRLTLLHSG